MIKLYKQDVDLVLKPTTLYEFEYTVETHDFKAYFDDNTTPDNIHLASFEVTNSNGLTRWINYKVHDGCTTTHVVDGNTIRYNGVHPGIDIKYEVLEDRMKEYIFVDSAENYRDIIFTITSDGCRWEEKDGGIYFYDIDTDEQLWVIEKPFILGQDANVSIYESGQIDRYQTFTVAIENPQGLVYPLVIDPTTIYTGAYYSQVEYSSAYNTIMAVAGKQSYPTEYTYSTTSANGSSWAAGVSWYTGSSNASAYGPANVSVKFGGKGLVFGNQNHNLVVMMHTASATNTAYTVGSYIDSIPSNILVDNVAGKIWLVASYKTTSTGAVAGIRLYESTNGSSWTYNYSTTAFTSAAGIFKDSDGTVRVVVNNGGNYQPLKFTGSTTYTLDTAITSYTWGVTYVMPNGKNVGVGNITSKEVMVDNVTKARVGSNIIDTTYDPTTNRFFLWLDWQSGDSVDVVRLGCYDAAVDLYNEQTVSLTGAKTNLSAYSYKSVSHGGTKFHFGAGPNYDSVSDPWNGKSLGVNSTLSVVDSVIASTFTDSFANGTYIGSSALIPSGRNPNCLLLKVSTGAYPSVLWGFQTGVSNSGGYTSFSLPFNYAGMYYTYDAANPAYYISTINFDGKVAGNMTFNLILTRNGVQTTLWTTTTSITTSQNQSIAVNKMVYLFSTDLLTVSFNGSGGQIAYNSSSMPIMQVTGYNNTLISKTSTALGYVISTVVTIPGGVNQVSVGIIGPRLNSLMTAWISFSTDAYASWTQVNPHSNGWVPIPVGATGCKYKLEINSSTLANYSVIETVGMAFRNMTTPGSNTFSNGVIERVLASGSNNSLLANENVVPYFEGSSTLPMNMRVLASNSTTLPFTEYVVDTGYDDTLTTTELVWYAGQDSIPMNENVASNTLTLKEKVYAPESTQAFTDFSGYTFSNGGAIGTAQFALKVDASLQVLATNWAQSAVGNTSDGTYNVLNFTNQGTLVYVDSFKFKTDGHTETFGINTYFDRNGTFIWNGPTYPSSTTVPTDITIYPQYYVPSGDWGATSLYYRGYPSGRDLITVAGDTVKEEVYGWRMPATGYYTAASMTSGWITMPAGKDTVHFVSATGRKTNANIYAMVSFENDPNNWQYAGVGQGARNYGGASRFRYKLMLDASASNTDYAVLGTVTLGFSTFSGSSYRNLTVTEKIWHSTFDTLNMVERPVDVDHLVMYENAFDGIQEFLPTYERIVVSESASLPIHEGVWNGIDSASLSVVERPVDGGVGNLPITERTLISDNASLNIEENIINYHSSQIDMLEKVYQLGVRNNVNLRERILIPDLNSLPMNERVMYPGSDNSLNAQERVLNPDVSTLPLIERTLVSTSDSLTAAEKVVISGASSIPVTEYIKRPGSSALLVRENAINTNTSMIPLYEKVIITGTASLPINERTIISGVDTLAMHELIGTPGTSSLVAKEKVINVGQGTLNLRERVVILGTDTLVMNERVDFVGSANLPIHERVIVSTSGSLPIRERTVIADASSLPVNERIIVSENVSLPVGEHVLGSGSSLLHLRERISADTVSFLDMYEFIDGDNISILKVHEYVSDESLSVLVRRSLFKKLTE